MTRSDTCRTRSLEASRRDGTRFATWFGSESAPLFGSIDLPEDRRCRGAVILCPPIGKEQVDSYRGLVFLAQQLRSQGLMVLRFDYLGTGDSSGAQDEPNAVAGWLDSIRAAVDYVRGCGIEDITLVGLRVGALLAAQVAETCGPLRSLVFWDPVIRGRTYLRKQTVLRQMYVGQEDSVDSRITLVGAVLAPTAAAQLSAMSIRAAERPRGARVLLAVREHESESTGVNEITRSWSADTIVVHDHDLFLEPEDFMVQIPFGDIDRIADWVASTFDHSRTRIDLDLRADAVVARTVDGGEIVETSSFEGESELFTIRTSVARKPDSSHLAAADETEPTVILYGTANEHRVGPVRLWVETARELAAQGIATIRFDRRGTGDTGLVQDGERVTIYTDESRADAVDVIAASGTRPDSIFLAGMCSGAWNSGYAAIEYPVRGVLFVNMADWTIRRKAFVKRSTMQVDTSVRGRLIALLHRHAKAVKGLLRVCLPYRGWLWLGRAGLLQVPEIMLAPLRDRGVHTTILLSPVDYEAFAENQGERSIRRLRRSGWNGRLLAYPLGDHSLYSTELRDRVRRDVLGTVLDEFGVRTVERAWTTDNSEMAG